MQSNRIVDEEHPDGLEFFDLVSKRRMKYIPADSSHWTAGWILYRHKYSGEWVTLREATDADLRILKVLEERKSHDAIQEERN